MNECLAPVLGPPPAPAAEGAGRAEGADGDLPALLPLEAVASSWDYAWFAVEQQGVYCQLV
jgi:hypothetical protein